MSCDRDAAPQHGKSWHLGLIGREDSRVAGAPTTVAYGPRDHTYEVAASAEHSTSRAGRSRPIESQGPFHDYPRDGKGVNVKNTGNSNKHWLTLSLLANVKHKTLITYYVLVSVTSELSGIHTFVEFDTPRYSAIFRDLPRSSAIFRDLAISQDITILCYLALFCDLAIPSARLRLNTMAR